MKKIISLMFVALLITSCGSTNNEVQNEDIVPNVEVEEINVVSEENTDTNVEVNMEDEAVEVSTWTVEVENEAVMEDDVELNEENEDQLIEEAINEIDNIINEIEADVK